MFPVVPSRMASGRARSTRKLRNWVLEQVESGKFPGVCWDDADKTMFRIPWKHAGKQDFREEQDAAFFKAWAIFKGKYREGDQADPAAWKTRLRCALNKSPEFEEVPERGHMEGPEPYKVYRLLPSGTLPGDYCPPCSPVPILGNNISHTLREGWNEFGESDSSFPKAEPSGNNESYIFIALRFTEYFTPCEVSNTNTILLILTDEKTVQKGVK